MTGRGGTGQRRRPFAALAVLWLAIAIYLVGEVINLSWHSRHSLAGDSGVFHNPGVAVLAAGFALVVVAAFALTAGLGGLPERRSGKGPFATDGPRHRRLRAFGLATLWTGIATYLGGQAMNLLWHESNALSQGAGPFHNPGSSVASVGFLVLLVGTAVMTACVARSRRATTARRFLPEDRPRTARSCLA